MSFCDAAVILCLFLQPFYMYFAFKAGKGEKIKVKLRGFAGKEKKISKEEEKNLREWKNILNYDGTRESQEEIEC